MQQFYIWLLGCSVASLGAVAATSSWGWTTKSTSSSSRPTTVSSAVPTKPSSTQSGNRGFSTNPSFSSTVAMGKKVGAAGGSEQLLPMVINTWNFTEANTLAWRILKQSEGGLRQTRNAVVEGCTKCEQLQCDNSVGYGGSPDELGETTLDAMVMDGSNMNVGAVAGLRNIKDAIRVARSVLEHTSHTMLVGNAATEFAQAMGFRTESLTTPESRAMWQHWKAKNCQPNFWHNVHPNPKLSCGPYEPKATPLTRWKEDRARTEHHIGQENHDTIGMIAIDVEQQIHVGTSTNGARYKIPGRVGDSPIAGAGGYADNEVGAAVATGDGDIMMRFLPTFLAVEAMRTGSTPTQAADLAVQRIIKHHKDFVGAVIAVDRLGQFGAACYGIDEFPFIVSNPTKKTHLEIVQCIPAQTAATPKST